MPYTVTKYPQGTFSWADIVSKDFAATKKFLTELFGWTYEDMPTGEGSPDYTMFYLDGKAAAGGSPLTPTMGTHAFWSNYITVDNVDEMAKKCEEFGGKIIMPAMDVFESGRMVGIQDPTGAAVMLWQPKNHIGASVVNKVGAMSWNELYTRDVEKAKEFYTKLFGWTYETDKENGYTTILNNGRMNGGIFAITEEMSKMPPCWMVYFTVENLEKSVAKVKEMGGTVYMDVKEISVGKIATVAEPGGAGFVLIEMSVPPTEWVE